MRVSLSYQLTHQYLHDVDDEPESGHVSADIYDDTGGRVEPRVGDIHIVIVDMTETSDAPWAGMVSVGRSLGFRGAVQP